MAIAQLPDGKTVELPDYASEATLSNLLSIMSGMSAEQQTSFGHLAGAIGGVGVTSKVTASQSGKQTSHLGNIAHSSSKNVRQSQGWFAAVLKQGKEQTKWVKKFGGSQAPQMLRGITNMMSGSGGLKNLLDLIPGTIPQVASAAIATATKLADVQRTLTDTGQGLGASITATAQALSARNLGIGDFQRIAGQYGTTLDYLNDSSIEIVEGNAALAKGVNKGALRFAQMSNEIQNQMQPWGAFGLKVEEINDYLGEYLNADRKRGVLAETSTSNLVDNFSKLAGEASLYAIDTGRNRKDMIKNQIETLSREDAAGHAMMLREQGQEKAAIKFEKNLGLISNELFGRFGTAGDEVKEMLIQAVMQGRGLEATDMGAEFGALFGEAGGVLNEMIAMFTKGDIDPAMFERLSIAMKNSQNSFDAQTYSILQHSNQSMQLMKTLRTEERYTTEHGRHDAKARLKAMKDGEAGEKILKGDRLLYKTTSQLQSALMGVVESLTSTSGFQKSLDWVTGSVNTFARNMANVNQKMGPKASAGDYGDALFKTLSGIPMNEAMGTTAAGATVVGSGMMLNKGLGALNRGKDQNAAIKQAVQKGILGNVLDGAVEGKAGGKIPEGSIKIGGKVIAKGGTFVRDGVEYKNTTGLKDGVKPTAKGMKALRTGRGLIGKTAGWVGAALNIAATASKREDINKEYESKIKAAGADTDEGQKLTEERDSLLYSMYGKTASGIAGGFAGAKMGAGLGSLLGPLGMLVGGVGGGIAGTLLGEEGFEYIKNLLQSSKEEADAKSDTSSTSILKKFDALIDRLDELLKAGDFTASATYEIKENTRLNLYKDPLKNGSELVAAV